MEIILKQDVTGLGYKNDTVKVKAWIWKKLFDSFRSSHHRQ